MKKIKLTENDLTRLITKVIKEQSEDEILESLLDGSQRLQRYIKDSRSGRDSWSKKDLRDIQELICGNLETLLDDSTIQSEAYDKRLRNEQEEEETYEDELELDFTTLNRTVNELQKKFQELEDDYMRKIGYGDHHQHPPPL